MLNCPQCNELLPTYESAKALFSDMQKRCYKFYFFSKLYLLTTYIEHVEFQMSGETKVILHKVRNSAFFNASSANDVATVIKIRLPKVKLFSYFSNFGAKRLFLYINVSAIKAYLS